ncbi:MAG: hypothetical protein DSY55_05940 [Clostridia bacterium]|nr:MAG: hypothetical protein DSY55_05940 [Clostridia bacterium]
MRPKLLLLTLLLLGLLGQPGNAQGPNHAGVVIRFADGAVRTACVAFEQESVTSAALLKKAGPQVIVDPASGFGEAICKISDGAHSNGCDFPQEDCFCQCQGATCVYWAFYNLENGQWVYANTGPSHHQIKNGDVDGWVWGAGVAGSGATDVTPPLRTFDEICPADARTSAQATAPPIASEKLSLRTLATFGSVILLVLLAGVWAYRRQA